MFLTKMLMIKIMKKGIGKNQKRKRKKRDSVLEGVLEAYPAY